MFDIGAIVKPYTDSIADLNKFNTELILTNKELLEACEEALTQINTALEGEWSGLSLLDAEQMKNKLESAIKKARGK